MLFSNLKPLITTAILLLGSTVSAHQPIDTSNSMKRDLHPNSILAVRSDGFSPRVHPRSIFEKREILGCDSSTPTECANDGTYVWCCPSDTECVKISGKWKCDPNSLSNTLGLTRGQKIGIGIGVTVLFFVICIVALVIFFCCCRKAAQIATAAVNNNNNNNNNPQGMYPPPAQPVMGMYGGPSPGYDPAAVPLNTGGDQGKPYVDAPTGYYGQPGQAGYESYGQQPQQQYQPHPGLQPSTSPAPPYQQPPPPPPGPPQQYTH